MQKNKKLISNLKFLLSLAYKQDPVLLWLYFATTILGVIFMFAVFFGFKLLIDAIAPTSPSPLFPAIVILTTYLLFEYLSRFVYYTVNNYYISYVFRSKMQNTLTIEVMKKVSNLDLAQIEDGKIRNLITKVFDTYNWTLPEIINTLNYIVYNTASILLSLLIATRFNPSQFLLVAVAVAPLFYLRAKYGDAEWSMYGVKSPRANQLWYLRGLFYENNILTEMKLYGFSNYILSRMSRLQTEILNAYVSPIAKYTLHSVVLSILIPIALFIPLKSYINPAQSGHTIGDFTLLLNVLFSFSTQLSNMLVNVGNLYKNNLYLNDFISLLSIKSALTMPKKPVIFKTITPRKIVFDNVTFTYPGSKKPAVKDVSFIIEKGENVAIVGENGAGKTTLIKLLLRFYDPDEGAIYIDGVNLKELDIGNWYRHIGMLFQHFGRYYFTLEENVALGNVLYPKDKSKISAALLQADAASITKELPKGLKNVLGKRFEEGQDLSTGQWQKVAIARALYRSAPYLILDEPTANIDASAEAKIFDNLIKQYKNKSLLFISHRFSTVRHADNIIVLHKSQVEAIGSHADLIKQGGLYNKFFSLQKRGFE